MIGMMYLVLMAMLALNVSNEVLNAFTVLDEGLTSTKETLEQTNSIVFANIDQENSVNPAKAGPWFKLALDIRSQADSMIRYIEDRKIEILLAAKEDTSAVIEDGKILIEHIKAKDKTDAPAIVMIGDNNDKAGSILRNKMVEYREFILGSVLGEEVSEKTRKTIESSLSTEDKKDEKSGEVHDWSRSHFEHLPMAGVLSIMNGIQINIRNAEAEALKYLYGNIDKGSFKFNNLDATVIPNSNYIIKGNEYKAEIFLAASDTTAPSVAYISDGRYPYDSTIKPDGSVFYTPKPGAVKIESNKAGKAIYRMPGGSLGERFWGGIIEMDGPGGVKIQRTFKNSYMVAEGSVVVSPTKMNVFYLGVDNPVDVSVAGVSPDKISIEVTNASYSEAGSSSFIVKPKRPGNSYVSVYAVVDGTRREMGRKEFRVKKVPDPIPKVNGISSGGISKNILLAQVGVAAEMENFDFDLKFTVTEFVVSTNIGGFLREEPSDSYRFTKAQRNVIEQLNKGQRVYIQDIKAVGPDGTPRSLPAIALLITN
ncbi:MAG: gliding motility protein GldM [Bacteroidales bacterium]|nr:gliding motility protein GldM [Bacteroidales bacterium]